MCNPTVSIIIPVFKAEQYLSKCIDSILNQTLKNIEVIIIDDESPDISGEIAERYALADSRVKVIHQTNSGPGAARNRGIKEAKGEYIGFVDADDWIQKDMYEKLYCAARNFDSEVVMCDFILEFSNKALNQERINPKNNIIDFTEDRIKELVFDEYSKSDGIYLCPLWNKIYRREFLVRHSLLINERYDHSEDWLFNLESLCKAERLSYVPEILYHYIQLNESSLTKKYRPNQFNIFIDLRKELLSKFNTYDVSIEEYKKYIDRSLCYKALMCIYSEVKSGQGLFYKLSNIRMISNNSVLRASIDNLDFNKNKLFFNVLMQLIKMKMNMAVFLIIKLRTIMSNLIVIPLLARLREV